MGASGFNGWQEELTQSGEGVHLPLARTWARVGGWTWLLLQASTTAFICFMYLPSPILFTRKHFSHF